MRGSFVFFQVHILKELYIMLSANLGVMLSIDIHACYQIQLPN